MLSWQEQVMTSEARYILARVCRQAGKTATAVNWSVAEPNERVIYVVPWAMQKDLVRDMIQRFFKSMVITTRDFTIALTNGTTIRILCAEEIRRDSAGLRATKIVVDEAGTIGGNLLDILTRCLADQRKAQMLLLSTEMKKDSLLEQVSNKQPSSALYVSYDYVDALREKAITPKQVFQYKSDLTPAYFASEFGPYTTFNIDNQTMEHVLRALDEYV